MSWSGFTSLAKSALSQAQKTIDRALDIKPDEEQIIRPADDDVSTKIFSKQPPTARKSTDDTDNFFAAFGLEEGVEVQNEKSDSTMKPVLKFQPESVNEATKKAPEVLDPSNSIWGSFSGSFFEGKKSSFPARAIESQPKKKPDRQRAVSLSDSTTEISKIASSESFPELIISIPPFENVETPSQALSIFAEPELSAVSELQVDQKASFTSVSSSSTATGESSSTLDESFVSEVERVKTLSGDSYSSSVSFSSLDLSARQSQKQTPADEDLNVTLTNSDDASNSVGYVIIDDDGSTPLGSPVPEVSNMLEDAMAESVKLMKERAMSPHSTVSSSSASSSLSNVGEGHRLDPGKNVESEQNSGHTSGDELETTTSSDIEIISSPSAGGCESGCERGESVSPIKPGSSWTQNKSNISGLEMSRHCYQRPQHPSSIRSDSPTSDTSSSTREGVQPVHTWPFTMVRPELLAVQNKQGKNKCKHVRKSSETGVVDFDVNPIQVDVWTKKIEELTILLESRETKVLELSRENVSLRDKNQNIKSQLQKVEESHAADTRNVSALTKEMNERLSSTEAKLQQALKDKEALSNSLQQATLEVATRVSATQVDEIKREKDAQIAELMKEGENLSKKVLQHSNNVKKLRAKEKENENHIKQQREKIEDLSRELDRVRKASDVKEEVEKNQIELIRQLTNNTQKLEKELNILKSEKEDWEEKQKSMTIAMESAYKELAQLHRKQAEMDSQALEASLSASVMAKEELRNALIKAQQEAAMQADTLIVEIESLRLSLTRSEQQSALREDAWRQDIANLQLRLQEAERRNEELNQNLSNASRPLLRQIDNLQSTLALQTSSWERVERNLTDRLNEAQNQLIHSTDKERAIAEKYADFSAKLASLESQNLSLKQNKNQLESQVTSMTSEIQLLKDSKQRESTAFEVTKHSFQDEIKKIKREVEMLTHQLEIEKTALEAEKRKTNLLQEQLKEKEQKLVQLSRSSPGAHSNASMRNSFSEQMQTSWYQDDITDGSLILASAVPTVARMNVYESLRAGSTASLLDSLQSQLKLRDGDIAQQQMDISHLEKVKESMSQELVALNLLREEMEKELQELRVQKDQFESLEKQYNALLQMYGEKVEENEELRMDLEDVKEMYKNHIDEFMGKS